MKPRGVAVLLAALTLTGCASNTPPAANTPPTGDTPPGCVNPLPEAVEKLQADITATIPDVTFRGVGAWVSNDSDFWYVAVTYDDPELGEVTGIWGSLQDVTSNPDPAFVAVDEVAEASSTYLQPVEFDGMLASTVDMDACITG